jgi:putative peptidoglycan binding protein
MPSMSRSGPPFLLACLLGLALVTPAEAAKTSKPRPPRVSWVRCFGVQGAGCPAERTVVAGGALQLAVKNGPTVRVLWPDASGRVRRVKPWWRTANRLWVRVPGWAATGVVRVLERGRRSNGRRVIVQRSLGKAEAFADDGMWIWQLEKVQGGDPDAIVAAARAGGIDTVYVKSGDGANLWRQFSPELVSRLKAGGLRVCAWQYVYGSDPEAEAAASAATVQRGADCFVIDAEAEYEGRYAAAQRYMRALRAAVGSDYPVALSSFPYVDYHPTFPYSVFLGPGGAQANLPQMYWKAIGVTPDRVFQKTYETNLPYGRPIFPLGQLYEAPPATDVARFRSLAQGYGARGVSWWSWQHARASDFTAALGQPAPGPAAVTPTWIALGRGSRGDLVVRAQELLRGGGATLPVSGTYGELTVNAVRDLQSRRGLSQTGVIDEPTWDALLKNAPDPTDWAQGAAPRASGRSASAG